MKGQGGSGATSVDVQGTGRRDYRYRLCCHWGFDEIDEERLGKPAELILRTFGLIRQLRLDSQW